MKNDKDSAAGHRKVRASMSLPQDLHEEIERIARARKVSIAWVVRDAVEKYVKSENSVSRKQQR
jgi:metal-responsive CopG/Arc/MetJ family transcriptional regulator